MQVMVNVTNVTNRLPPLDNVTYGGQNYDASYDQAGASAASWKRPSVTAFKGPVS